MGKITHLKLITAAMMSAIFMVSIDTTIVTTAMPKIVSQLSGLNLISWVFAIYLLTTTVTTPIYGKLADLFGRKPIFLFGVALFLLGSLVSGMARTMPQLILFRGLQGLGGGAVMPITMTIIGDLYPGEARARIQGLFSTVWGVTGLLGPLLGGVIVDRISWHWIFFINLPIGIVAIALVAGFLNEPNVTKSQKSIDYWGGVCFAVAIGSLLFVLIGGGEILPWNSPAIIALLTVALVFLLIFFQIESKAKEPMLPLSLFKIRVIAVADLVAFLVFFVNIGVTVYMPVWIQTLLGHSATNSGLTLMPMTIVWPVAAALAGRYMYKIGIKNVDVFGALLVCTAAASLLLIPVNSAYWVFVIIMIVYGFGMGCATMPLTVLIQLAVGRNLRGSATASQEFSRTLGQTVGIAVYGALFNNGWQDGDISNALAHSLRLVFILAFAIALVALFFSNRLPTQRQVLEIEEEVMKNDGNQPVRKHG